MAVGTPIRRSPSSWASALENPGSWEEGGVIFFFFAFFIFFPGVSFKGSLAQGTSLVRFLPIWLLNWRLCLQNSAFCLEMAEQWNLVPIVSIWQKDTWRALLTTPRWGTTSFHRDENFQIYWIHHDSSVAFALLSDSKPWSPMVLSFKVGLIRSNPSSHHHCSGPSKLKTT